MIIGGQINQKTAELYIDTLVKFLPIGINQFSDGTTTMFKVFLIFNFRRFKLKGVKNDIKDIGL
ncbi:hypothetical protein C7A12_12280 [Pseudomonas fluorescens]|nr:hypothetical protein CF150_13703 [Pseudomonas sp. CF150]ONH35295.1 hypothetical protein BLL38_28835 [Pseudomonas gessardii]PRW77307.1 hypothetical protein C7A12_12280 [Pseudomonas fluorescens]PRW79125.1 hypothetical protein C7A13_11520 [Pseudomonas fluorescens]